MTRRLFAVMIAISLGGWVLAAVERGTFVLTNGERVSGAVVFHGDNHENLINNYLNLAVDGEAKERTYPIDQVAIIEFVGGKPADAELAALPTNPRHLLVLRNGDTKVGRFVNLISGVTLKWQDGGTRQTRDIPISDVARIYLNADNARRLYNYTAPAAGAAGAGPQLPAITTAPGEIEVNANVNWNPTQVGVRSGDRYAFVVRGQIAFGSGPTQVSGPDGDPTTRAPRAQMPGVNVGALIGKIQNGAPFVIGGSGNVVTMSGTGPLYLAINDDNYVDNSGAYRVTIVKR